MLLRTVLRSCSIRHSTTNKRHVSTKHYDAVIVGGGVAGLSMANLLQESCPRFSVAVLERGNGAFKKDTTTVSVPNPRSYALSPKSLKLLGEKVLKNVPLGYYESMQIWEAKSPAMLVFSHHDLPSSEDYLGACTEDTALVSSLWEQLETSSSVTLHTNTTLSEFSIRSNLVALTTKSTTDDSVTTKSSLTTSLLIGADGSQSNVRNELSIPWRGVEYGRSALTFTVQLQPQNRYKKRAYQRFLPAGPVALLPTYSPEYAVVVWSTTPDQAAILKSLSDDELMQRLNDVLQQGPERLDPLLEQPGGTSILANLGYGVDRVLDTIHYGMGMRHWSDDPELFLAPPKVQKIASPRFTFPLQCKVASNFTSGGRVALIGDAAHTVHPLAGQGLNLGLDDVASLHLSLKKSHDSGMDVAQFLHDYEHDRQYMIPFKVGGIHLLHSIFGLQSAPMLHSKSLGMSIINQSGQLRRQLAKIATGLE